MLRKIILLGIFTGGCASLPIFYELNPGAVERWHAALTDDVPSMEQAVPSAAKLTAAPKLEPISGRNVLVKSDATGHFNADFKLNGRNLRAMIDTGATYIALNRSAARRIGLAPPRDAFIHEVKTANGGTRAATAMIERVQIGRITVENVEALILEDQALDGVLVGMSFLQRLSSFEMQGGSLFLRQ